MAENPRFWVTVDSDGRPLEFFPGPEDRPAAGALELTRVQYEEFQQNRKTRAILDPLAWDMLTSSLDVVAVAVVAPPRYWVTVDGDGRPTGFFPNEDVGPTDALEITSDQYLEFLANQKVRAILDPRAWDMATSSLDVVARPTVPIELKRRNVDAQIETLLSATDLVTHRDLEQQRLVDDGELGAKSLTDAEVTAWRRWRQSLRSLDTTGDPDAVVIPDPPSPIDEL